MFVASSVVQPLWDFQSQAWHREEAVRPEGRHVTPAAWPGMELVVVGMQRLVWIKKVLWEWLRKLSFSY